MRAGVEVLLELDMAVQLYLTAINPFADLIAYSWKRSQAVLLLVDEYFDPGAAPLLERRLIVFPELLRYSLAEFLERVETPVAQLCDY